MPLPRKPRYSRRLRTPIAGALFALSMALAACGTRPAKGPDEFVVRSARLNTQGANDPQERLRDELGEFKTSFDRIIARMEMSASSLAGDDPERLGQIQRDIRAIDRLFTAAYSEPDARVALVELWYDAYRLDSWRRKYRDPASHLVEGIGTAGIAPLLTYRFPDPLLVNSTAIVQILNRIRDIARRWLSPDTYRLLDERIRQRAELDETTDDFLATSRLNLAPKRDLVDPTETNGLLTVLGLPFAPLAAADSLSRTAAEVGIEARRVADRIDRLPSDLGHQIELVVLEVLTSPQVTAVLDDVTEVAESFSRISEEAAKIEGVVDRLPTRIREEATVLLDASEGRADELLALSDSLRGTFEQGDRTLASLQAAGVALTDLAVQLETTTTSLDEVFGFSAEGVPTDAAREDPLVEIRRTAEAITETSQALQELLSATDLPAAMDRVDQSTTSAADLVASRLGALLFLVFALAFGLAVGVGGSLVWIVRRPTRRGTTAPE